MKIVDLIDEIAHRVGREVFSQNGEPYILNVINRLYRQINARYGILEKSITFPPSDFDSKKSVPVPSDLSMVKLTKPYLKPYQSDFFFLSDIIENGYTIYNGRIYVSQIPQKDITFYYESIGKKLVTEVSNPEIESDVIEWPDKISDILFYGSCIQLSTTYPFFKYDSAAYLALLEDIGYYGRVGQTLLPKDGIPDQLENEAIGNANDYEPH